MEKNCTFSCHGKLTWPLKRRPFKKGKPASSHHQFSSIHQRCLLGWLAIPEIWCRWIIDALWNPTSLFVSSCWFWGWWNFRQLLAQRWFFPPVFGDVVSWHDIRQTTLHTGYDDMTTAGLLSQWKSANIFQFPRKLGWVPVLPGRQSSRESFLFASEANFGDAKISRVFVKHHHARNLCSYVCLDMCELCLYLVRVMSCYALSVCNDCSWCPTFFKRCFACHPLLQVFHEAQSEMVLAHNPATNQEPFHFFTSHLNCASTIL